MKFAAIGECLIELSEVDDLLFKLGFAGDTFNTAYYFKKLANNSAVHYITAVGGDKNSTELLNFIQKHGIDTSLCISIQNKTCGLYLIENDLSGERQFEYYREYSAARQLLYQLSEPQLSLIASFDALYFSGISLAILDDYSRKKLFEVLVAAKKHGAQIFFDNNYRKRLWKNREEAIKTMTHFHPLCDVVFATYDDEAALFGDGSISTTIKRYLDTSIRTVVIKDGKDPCQIIDKKKHHTFPLKNAETVIDTTGAGDSFNAGFLSARLAKKTLLEQVNTAHKIALNVIAHKGAIIPSGNQVNC